jgi:hypothetical protein
VTDLLAKPWLSFNVDFKIFNFTPNFVPLPLLAENTCISFSRSNLFEIIHILVTY